MIFYDGHNFVDGGLSLPVDGAAFRYGISFFETLLWDGDHVCQLEAHCARIHASLRTFGYAYDAPDYAQLLTELAKRNGFGGKSGRLNIIYAVREGLGVTQTMRPVLTIAPYTIAPAETVQKLCFCPQVHQSWLAAHKTANYLPYIHAHQQANAAGFDDAILLTADGYVLESSSSALCFFDGEQYISPLAPPESGAAILPSTALASVRDMLHPVFRPVHRSELANFQHVYVLNSLRAMLAVSQIEGHDFAIDVTPCAPARAFIHSPDQNFLLD
ncbi:aminotransferase class IV [Desulfobaculum bizertense]|uniref:4-amino-4-deoxychorismate lyase n=1 Tax=Desulfobaculum bizertense DSM 18034 TaxID=1121442 RepID=A0A1T4W871_9BACT|nr:aminotransferase class IV [Desulfobaculum bizertense]SKA73309.1 4-amino-4-deoxychorismate lyase [Desulfobaculum bizertense DSM 18034]